jgi:hypothetical protein
MTKLTHFARAIPEDLIDAEFAQIHSAKGCLSRQG